MTILMLALTFVAGVIATIVAHTVSYWVAHFHERPHEHEIHARSLKNL